MRFLSFPFNALCGIGIFPFDNNSSKWTLGVFYVYRAVIFIITTSISILMTIQLFVAPDLTMLARTIDIWTMFLSGIYKWFCMTMFREEFTKLKTTLTEIQRQGNIAYGSSANQFTANYLKSTKKVTFWYIFSGILVSIFITGSALVTYPKGDRSDFEYFNDPRSYPVSCWIPFVVYKKWMFLTIFIFHTIALTIVILMYLGIDSFMFGAIHAIGGQIDILNLSINKIESTIKGNQFIRYDEKQQKQCYSILRECAKYHILILGYIRNIRVMFSTLIIVDYMHGITSLTFALFQMTTNVDISEAISIALFFVVSLTHQFLNNFFGEFIIQKQLTVRTALYHVPWWRASTKVRQLLLLMIKVTIKPTTIMGFYMYKLSYESFIAFVKALYTYYMVLRRVNVETST